MHLPLQEPPQQCKVLAELLHSQRLVRPEDYQIGQLAAEVIKLRKEAEAARLEPLALDKELQLSMLLDKLQLDPLVDPDPPPLVEISQEGHNQSNNKYKGPKHRQLPRRHLQQDCWVDNHRRDRQEGHQEVHHKQQHRNKRHKRHGTNGAMKGQPPTIFDGERSKTNQFMTEFQLWWMINNGAEVMNNPFQR